MNPTQYLPTATAILATKFFILVGLSFTAFSLQAQSACKGSACPLELSGPQTTIENPMSCGTTQVLIYTLKNNAPVAIGIADFIDDTLGGDTSANSTVDITGGSCGNSAPAMNSCSIIVTINAAPCLIEPGHKFPETINRQLVVDPDINQGDLTAPIRLQVVDTTPPPSPFVAAVGGQDQTTIGNPPLLAVHNAAGIWTNVLPPPAVTAGRFDAASCTGANTNAICAVAGIDTTNSPNFMPLLYVSQDGGMAWSVPTFNSTLPVGSFNDVSCIGSGTTGLNPAVCVAVGRNTSAALPMVFRSVDGGSSWTSVTLPIGSSGTLEVVSCTGTGASNHTCAVGGESSSSTPVLQILTESSFISATSIPLGMEVARSVACTTTTPSNKVVCSAAMLNSTSNTGALWVNIDARTSTTWAAPASVTVPSGAMNHTACTTISSGAAVCTAVGNSNQILVSIDAGTLNSWGITPTLSAASFFLSTDCLSVGTTALCTAAGSGTSPVFMNTDMVGNDVNWSAVTLTSLPSINHFHTTACGLDTGNPVCIAAGTSGSPTVPLIYVNTSTITSAWTQVTTTPPLPAHGSLQGAGATRLTAEDFFYGVSRFY